MLRELKRESIKAFLIVFDLSMFHNCDEAEKEGGVSTFMFIISFLIRLIPSPFPSKNP